ncbi:OLC1v1010672C1 [Oldenlandia corymbosa var. corymbosa]|uniref:OLC1v1010672C1 n=1 Tax=Oldenlandia corymbosa var. corymbosa TaxID=529605 RepID=A0AAV1DRW4_OLDCO|nr:OLC1v1010672C1 [Oldenlandia corymbosa var. corymbosa]
MAFLPLGIFFFCFLGQENGISPICILRMVDTAETGSWSSPEKVECRICHDEDQDSNMETPCSCTGSMKYAHRKCVQRWCNEKGDTICEICRQGFKPGYLAPSPLSRYGRITSNFREGWEISRRALPNTEFITMVAGDDDFLDHDFDDFPSPNLRNLICCRIVAIIFVSLLVLRHTLPVIINGREEYSLTLFMFISLRIIGILLPIYVMVKAFTAVQHCRHQQISSNSRLSTLTVGNGSSPMRPPSQHVIHLR